MFGLNMERYQSASETSTVKRGKIRALLFFTGTPHTGMVRMGSDTSSPGKRSLTFLAQKSGRTGLRLIYVRPWKKDQEPANEFNLMVIVKDDVESEP